MDVPATFVSYRRADEVFAFEADSGSESGWRECVV